MSTLTRRPSRSGGKDLQVSIAVMQTRTHNIVHRQLESLRARARQCSLCQLALLALKLEVSPKPVATGADEDSQQECGPRPSAQW